MCQEHKTEMQLVELNKNKYKNIITSVVVTSLLLHSEKQSGN